MSVLVLSPGTQTTLQDLGRRGLRALGVAASGAADVLSLEVANRLVGNPPHATAVELAWSGPRLRFERASVIALAGAHVQAQADGAVVPNYRPIVVAAGAVLELGALSGGARAYLAVAGGGFDVAPTLGSAATDLVAGIGGIDGRPLRKGDALPLRADAGPAVAQLAGIVPANWWMAEPPHLPTPGVTLLRVLPGAHAGLLEDEARGAFGDANWRVSHHASRMGLRLEGPPLAVAASELISEPVAIGTVQLPPDGAPIVLGVEAQTVGGYPRIAHVIGADWPRLGQLRPGDQLRFVRVDDADARAARVANQKYLGRVAEAMKAKLAR